MARLLGARISPDEVPRQFPIHLAAGVARPDVWCRRRVGPHTSASQPGTARYLAPCDWGCAEARLWTRPGRRAIVRFGPIEGPTVRVKGPARSNGFGRHNLTSCPRFADAGRDARALPLRKEGRFVMGPSRQLPVRPNLEHLRNEAKQRLKALRVQDAATRLTDAQLLIARGFRFPHRGQVKAAVDEGHHDGVFVAAGAGVLDGVRRALEGSAD